METISQKMSNIHSGAYDKTFEKLYGKEKISLEKERYLRLMGDFIADFQRDESAEVRFFSAPGRTEVGGNHTDHQQGCVLAAAVNLDAIAVVEKTENGKIEIKSQGYPLCAIDISDLEVKPNEINTTLSLIRGVTAGLKKNGYKIGSFRASVTSEVFQGSGLSSSAAFEVLVGVILNHLYNDGQISSVEIAQISQFAENVYFGKPSGLMDQMASSVGGFVAIDFEDPKNPKIEKVNFNLSEEGYDLAIVDTRSSHDDLTDEYGKITEEMGEVAKELNGTILRETDEKEFYDRLPELREKLGDRAVLRAMHFYQDNQNAQEEAKALNNGDIEAFLNIVNNSGQSSFYCLQNVYVSTQLEHQSMTIALATAKKLLGNKGASRIHGGGFAGTIQAFVPKETEKEFALEMDRIFGEGACHFLEIREYGGIEVTTSL